MKVTNGLDLQAQRITNMADPSVASDAVTKNYADNLARGAKWKDPVRAATTANGALATAFANAQTVDGVVLATGDRVLLKNQTAGAENGIYVVAAAGAPARAVDAATAGQITAGVAVYVQEGTVNADKAFAVTTDGAITIGTTSTTWGQLGGGTSYVAGNGLALAGSTFSAQAVAAGGIVSAPAGLSVDTTVVARKFSANVGNGTLTSIAVTHNLGTKDVEVSLRETATDAGVLCDYVATDINNVTFTFPTAPAANAYRATIVG